MLENFTVFKALRKEAAEKVYEVLSGIEGLLVLPITECYHVDDVQRCREKAPVA